MNTISKDEINNVFGGECICLAQYAGKRDRCEASWCIKPVSFGTVPAAKDCKSIVEIYSNRTNEYLTVDYVDCYEVTNPSPSKGTFQGTFSVG